MLDDFVTILRFFLAGKKFKKKKKKIDSENGNPRIVASVGVDNENGARQDVKRQTCWHRFILLAAQRCLWLQP
jgi:DNA-binding transcriptional regulator PaaX